MTEAHDQRLTLHLVTHVPEHEPREDDPHYHLFEQVKARMKRQGLWKCVINDDYCGGNVELHHAHIEYSQTNSTDLDKINHALGLHIESDEEFQKWIESPGNLEPLCLPASSAVLMANGSTKPIARVRVGDHVIGHDMVAHAVTMTSASDFAGQLVSIDGRRMTGNHPVLTPSGWRPAIALRPGDLVCWATPAGEGGRTQRIGMLDAQVLGLGGVEPEVFRSVVMSNPVDMVHPLRLGQRPAHEFVQDKAMLHDRPTSAVRPIDNTSVALVGKSHTPAPAAAHLIAVQAEHPTGSRAVAMQPGLDLGDSDKDLRTALDASHPGMSISQRATTFRRASGAARAVPLGNLRWYEVVSANDAPLNDAAPVAVFERRWRPILHVERIRFIGQVYDIGVDGCRSFVADGMVVHNCEVHHRTHFGVHVIPGPLWEPLRYRKWNAKPSAEFLTADDAAKGDTVVKTKTTKTTTVRQHPTKEDVVTDTAVDEKTDVKVKAAHRTVSEHVEEHRSEDKQTVPRPHKVATKPEKKGFFSRMFGN